MPTPYRHILVCLDLSPVSLDVLSRAGALAQREDGRLTVLHVVDHRPLPDLDYGLSVLPGFELDLETVLGNARTQLDELLMEAGMTDATREVVAGVPHSEIILSAETLKADLIVLGSTGRTGLGRLLGSTAHSVLNHTPCDVLAVRVQKNQNSIPT